MRKELAPLLLCPACLEGRLNPGRVEKERGGLEEGALHCDKCREEFPVRKGIADLLYQPSREVRKEVEAWSSFCPCRELSEEDRERSREWLRSLPFLEGQPGPRADLETWRRHGQAVLGLCEGIDWEERWVLELGAGRCWLSAQLARQGARVVAVDILEADYIGLDSAEVFLEEGARFDRVLCDMHHLPFKPDSFDAVVATATLHHSHDPVALLREVKRVLKPQGLMLAANEPLYVPWREVTEEERKGAHERSYSLRTWLRFFRESGLTVTELKVGREAALHLKALPAEGGDSLPLAQRAAGGIRYAGILALALPRRSLRWARALKAGWPMRPWPKDRGAYLRARMGLRDIGTRALPGKETNWGPGWYQGEGGDELFRWCGPRSRLLLSGPGETARLVLELATFHPNPQADPVVVEVYVGSSKVGSIRIDKHGWDEYKMEVTPGTGRRPVPITLRVRSGYFLPRDMGLGEDMRLLGAACRGAWWETAG
jgi:SAM-dependent methyltransferase